MNETAEQLKLEGMEAAASKYGPDLCRAQIIAALLGRAGAAVSSDDVREAFAANYGYPLRIGNAMGKIFESEKWECVGRIRSRRKEAHSRWIFQWRLKT